MGVAVAVTATRGAEPRPAEHTAIQLRSFCAALSEASGLAIEPHVTDSYPALLEAMKSHRIHMAWMPPVVALRTIGVGHALPLALPVRGGHSSFHTALFTQPDSKFRDELDLFGAKAGWVDKDSAAGYLVIRAAMRSRGLGFERAFKEERFLGSHTAVVRAVLDREVDVGATYVHFGPGEKIFRAGWGESSVHVISTYGPIPADVITAANNLPVQQIRALQGALLDAKNSRLRSAAKQLFEAESFVEAETSHLNPLSALLRYIDDAPKRWGSIFPPGSTRTPRT